MVEQLCGRAARQSPRADALRLCHRAAWRSAPASFIWGARWLFYRAVSGLRTSWLSREALAFGLFAQLAVLYGVSERPVAAPFPGKELWLSSPRILRTGAAVLDAGRFLFGDGVRRDAARAVVGRRRPGFVLRRPRLLLGSAAVFAVGCFTSACGEPVSTALRIALAAVVMVATRAEARLRSGRARCTCATSNSRSSADGES